MKHFFLFLLAGIVTLGSCKKSSSTGDNGDPNSPRTTVPDELLLSNANQYWGLSASGSTHEPFMNNFSDFWADHSNLIGNVRSAQAYKFTQNGDYDFWTFQANNSGCGWVQTYGYYKGTVEVKNGTITFHPVTGRVKLVSECNPSQNYDRTATASDKNAVANTYLWNVTNPAGYYILNFKTSATSGNIQYTIEP